jgi:flagella basal body P-ring formation protein FlgA
VILEGQAQSSGRRGETIGVRNPATGKILRVIVTDPGRAELPALVGESGDQ